MSDLHEAVSSKDKERLAHLIREGADLEAVDDQGRTALFYAVTVNQLDMVRVLLESGANPNTPRTRCRGLEADTSPLMHAARNGPDSIVEMLLAHGVEVNYRRSVCSGKRDNCSALDMAVEFQNWTSARLLVEAGADMTPPSFWCGEAHDQSPLIVAASFDQWEVVELMLEKGANPNYITTKHWGGVRNQTALHTASTNGCTRTIRVLCEWGADVHAVSQTDYRRVPLHMAAFSWPATLAAVSALVVAGADQFALDVEGRTVVEALVVEEGTSREEEVLLDSRPSRF